MLNIRTSKNGEPLHIPLNAAALAALKLVYQRGDGTGRAFQFAKTGDPLESGWRSFEQPVEKAEIADFHWHDLRHTFATRLRTKGTALEDITDLLGHKSWTMSKRYSHLGPAKLHEVVSHLDSTNSAPAAPEPKPGTLVSGSYLN